MQTLQRSWHWLFQACLVAVVATALPALAQAQSSQVEWRGVERIVAFADVHGAFDELSALLREAGIIDAQNHWAAGGTHVVSLGDLLDRGADSRKVMDMLMRLQGEAGAAGGALHVILGNHEAMNVLGDLRYVTPGEYAAYSDLEKPEVRQAARDEWILRHGPESAAAFEQRFPRGYFGHRAALAPGGWYGNWLLGLPVAIVINDTLFMHAGPSKVLQGMTLQDLNTRYREALKEYLASLNRLEQAGLLQPGDAYSERPRLAAERLALRANGADSTPEPTLAAALKRFEQADRNPLIDPDGPNWYRGAALCNEVAETDVLLPALRQFKAARVVVGHTVARNFRAATRFDGRVVKLDAGMNRAAYKGRAAALMIQGDKLEVRYGGEPNTVPPQPEGLYVAPNEIDDASVAVALRDGQVSVSGPRGPGEVSVTVDYQGRRIPAVFVSRSDASTRNELAAYRLDRRLGLGIVPATVVRDVQGQRGVLQARPVKWLTQAEVQRQAIAGGGWCAVEPQYQLVYAFDALLGNEGRTPDNLFFDADEWYVYATGHDRAFGGSRAFPAYLKASPPAPGDELRRRLATLTDGDLATLIGDLVDAKARKAILQRRDQLLELPAAAAKRPVAR